MCTTLYDRKSFIKLNKHLYYRTIPTIRRNSDGYLGQTMLLISTYIDKK